MDKLQKTVFIFSLGFALWISGLFIHIFVSFLFSTVMVLVFDKLLPRSKQSAFLFACIIFVLLYGLRISTFDGISYFGYWASNY